LIANGASINAKNPAGMTVMHLAAQGNQAYSLAYFKSKYLDINERDNSDSTPLHWAMINLSANAIDYLLAWGCEINI
jgi:ankyrin repeat protein